MEQTPEQKARDTIDAALVQSGWLIQDKKEIDLALWRKMDEIIDELNEVLAA